MTRKPWTNHEDELLARRWKEGISGRKLCAELPGRSESSIRCRARWKGLVRDQPILFLWTAEDDAAIRKMWKMKGPLKLHMSLLPNRSWRSVVERGHKIGLKPRGNTKHSTAYSWVREEIDRALSKHRALTACEISKIVPASPEYIAQQLRNYCGERYYIAGWAQLRPCGNGSFSPKYALGSAPNAPKPELKPHAKCQKEYRARETGRTAPMNPFAVAMNQVMLECAA